MKEIKKELVLLNDIQEISRLASFIEVIGEELSLPATVAFNLNLALEEAVSNIILYAYPDQTGKRLKCMPPPRQIALSSLLPTRERLSTHWT